MPLPDVSLLNPPLGAVEPLPSRIKFISDVGGLSPIQVALFGLADASGSMDCTTADGNGFWDVLRHGTAASCRHARWSACAAPASWGSTG